MDVDNPSRFKTHHDGQGLEFDLPVVFVICPKRTDQGVLHEGETLAADVLIGLKVVMNLTSRCIILSML
jgi:hypothetical protein